MQTCILYHNPACSKSRATLELLRETGHDPVIIEYLKTPLTIEQLYELSAHFPLKDFVRTGEAVFQQLNLSIEDKDTLLNAMVHHPKLMQRPIVTFGGKAAIGRPPENVLTLFEPVKSCP